MPVRPRASILAFMLSLPVAACAAGDDPGAVSLTGMVDLHIHTAPDNRPRSLDDLQAAEAARDAGMRAIVLKNHEFQTAARAQMASRAVPGIEVYGGVALNLASGGLNAHAVDAMARLEGGRGKIVWLPTRTNAEVPVLDEAGTPRLELLAVFEAIARYELVLATGHIRPEESLAVVEAARAAGVERILVTHALSPSVSASLAQMRAMAEAGASIELVYMPTIGDPGLLDAYAEAVREIGAQHFILATDLGQADNPLPVDGLRRLIYELKQRGINDTEFDLMLRRNPTFLLNTSTNTEPGAQHETP